MYLDRSNINSCQNISFVFVVPGVLQNPPFIPTQHGHSNELVYNNISISDKRHTENIVSEHFELPLHMYIKLVVMNHNKPQLLIKSRNKYIYIVLQ